MKNKTFFYHLLFRNQPFGKRPARRQTRPVKETTHTVKAITNPLPKPTAKVWSRTPIPTRPTSTSAMLYISKGNMNQRQASLILLRQPGMDKNQLANVYHNLGNTMMEQQKYKEAAEAYKEALRNNPTDAETRYNLVYALEKLKESNSNSSKRNQDQNQDQQDQENKEDQEKQENQDEQENQENEEQQDQEQKEGGEDQEQEQKQGQEDQQKKGAGGRAEKANRENPKMKFPDRKPSVFYRLCKWTKTNSTTTKRRKN